MSVATDLQSVIDAKEAVRQAIIAKGVEVPAEAKLDTYHSYIDRIASEPEGDGTEWGTLYYGSASSTTPLVLASESDYKALGNSASGGGIMVNGQYVSKSSIVEFSFGKKCTYTPASFLSRCNNLIRLSHTSPLKEVGNLFLYESIGFVGPLEIPNCTQIGTFFLSFCSNFASPLVIPATVTKIGDNFMSRMTAFTGLLDIKTVIAAPPSASSYPLTATTVNDATYASGVRITGPGATAWAAALPNSESDKRKLILVEG